MQKTRLSDHLFSGSSFSGVITIENLIPLSNITYNNNVVRCLVSQKSLKKNLQKDHKNLA